MGVSGSTTVAADVQNPSSQRAYREIEVTTLADYRRGDRPVPGSLRWAVNQRGPSVIRFAVSGNIDLADKLVISEPYVAIDGSTAPGEGITLRRIQVEVTNTHDVVLRHLRFRCGDGFAEERDRRKVHGNYDDHGPRGSGGWRSLLIWGTKRQPTRNILIEHCSIQNSTDDNASVWGNCRGVTFRKCLFSGGYVNPTKGLLTGTDTGKPNFDYPDYLTVDRCLFAFMWSRAPDVNGSVAQIVNCLIVGTRQGGIVTKSRANIVNNSFWTLPDHPWGPNADRLLTLDVRDCARGAHYVSGNELNGVDANLKVLGVRNMAQAELPSELLRESPWPGLPDDLLSASEAAKEVLRDAGCSQPVRDEHDAQVIARVKARMSKP